MTGERDLDALLRNMKPEMLAGTFVFCTIPPNEPIPAAVNPLLTFREQEGTTLVILREEAEASGLRYAFASRLITLTVHSALDAVGFLAAVTAPPGRSRHQRECGVGLPPRSSFRACRQGR